MAGWRTFSCLPQLPGAPSFRAVRERVGEQSPLTAASQEQKRRESASKGRSTGVQGGEYNPARRVAPYPLPGTEINVSRRRRQASPPLRGPARYPAEHREQLFFRRLCRWRFRFNISRRDRRLVLYRSRWGSIRTVHSAVFARPGRSMAMHI